MPGQSSQTHKAGSPAKAKAYQALKTVAKRHHSLRMAAMAAMVQTATEGHFDVVIGSVDKMIAELRAEELEERNVDGLVKATNTQIWTWGLIIGGSILVILLIAAFVYIFMTWEFGGQTGHERVTMFCLRLEDRIFPVTMYKNKSYT